MAFFNFPKTSQFDMGLFGGINQMMNSMLEEANAFERIFPPICNTGQVMPFALQPHGMPTHRNGFGHEHLWMNALSNMGRGLGGVPMGGCNFSSSSTVISMTSGPDGKPQVYEATSSTKVGPGGVKQTQRTVSDSVTGTKKMAIGHHIGERAHIIEKEQNMHTGDREERQDFINIDEEETDEFYNEWRSKTRTYNNNPSRYNRALPAIAAPETSTSANQTMRTTVPTGRRSIRDNELTRSPYPSITQGTPYSHKGHGRTKDDKPRKSKNIKTVSGSNQ